MTSLRRTIAAFAGATLLFGSLAACSSERSDDASDGGSAAAGDTTIGIAMPTKSLERWNNDGTHLQELLQDEGYKTSLQYADNKVDQQITQIQNMINDGADVLVIASIDGTALGPVLQTAADADIPVIAYDRLINDTENVDYYATFDNELVGTLQGQFIEEQLGLKDGEGPFNLEPFAGSPDDNNAKFFFKGAWDVLSPYVESGQLVVPSGKAPATVDDWTTIGIQGWESAKAQSEMENRLNSFYADKKVDVVLSPNDSLALGIEQALDGAGYTEADWPLITGQDADQANTKNMLAGKQSMTVWKDTRTLGDQVAKMVTDIVNGDTPETNDDETYDNGVKVVPSYLLPPQVVTADTVQEMLVDSGFYSAADLGL
ncbi:monosaccharide ABC transporter substrate-binding protein (CUT2 family) [Sediminihabitans luteus]|uniref:Monosaccharide ABC transporter substrate-binding protein (CUT2 family) n=1 Tax=Sediminihabitans luteus TaxID=1138585 RepID=A0A2M9CZ53_9CELL|nr:multiple monosaccharide ABC transporter substrate-binding protein [Sediminihabitans luteus]PJJ77133.1 monosaccharide ABC transporter substrate-binding protein (CUT2 family) [Sediminihabitans luteus]GII98581.1 multiple sugar-binding periplasmic receptor ChvE [Sediminihabitans luteus]